MNHTVGSNQNAPGYDHELYSNLLTELADTKKYQRCHTGLMVGLKTLDDAFEIERENIYSTKASKVVPP